MNRNEMGSEVVQFICAVFALLTVLFGSLYAACFVTTASVLSSELSRACVRLDVPGLSNAPDKARFVAGEIAGESSQLDFDSITIGNVNVSTREGSIPSGSKIDQRSRVTTVSFDVTYRMPLSLGLAGVPQPLLSRSVSCSIESERVSEVAVS